MPYFVFQGFDRFDAAELRKRIRDEHRAHLRQAFPGCRCVLGGPLTDEADQMIGTALVLDADSREAAEGFLARDPYAVHRLFKEARLTRWNWTIGQPQIEPTAPPR